MFDNYLKHLFFDNYFKTFNFDNYINIKFLIIIPKH